MPVTTIDFAKDYGFENLTPPAITKALTSMKNSETEMEYILNKIGFDLGTCAADPLTFNNALNLAANWSLIDKEPIGGGYYDYNNDGDLVYCQGTHGKSSKEIQQCVDDRREKYDILRYSHKMLMVDPDTQNMRSVNVYQ